MTSFNGNVNLWTHYENEITESLRDIPINKRCSFDAEKRIGSQSTMAQVFRVSINTHSDTAESFSVAVKVLPIINRESFIQIENEITIAKLASDFTASGKSKYFPIVYDFMLCEDTKFYNSSGDIPYYEKSKRFQEYELLFSLAKGDKETIRKIDNLKKKFVDAEITAKKVFPNDNIVFTGKVESFLLFSELANCDLKYYLNNNTLSDGELMYILRETFLAIYDLHTKLGVVHADLHLGNVLVKTERDSPRLLIHDFGKSYFSDFTTEYERKDDITHFIGHFLDAFELKGLSQDIKDYIDKILDIVNDSKEKFIIEKIIKIK
jgi:hypothetical protein